MIGPVCWRKAKKSAPGLCAFNRLLIQLRKAPASPLTLLIGRALGSGGLAAGNKKTAENSGLALHDNKLHRQARLLGSNLSI
jgi:hypothetical protein